MNVLVTGGAGYIGSHICLELLQQNHNVLVVDNLHNSTEQNLINVGKILSEDLCFDSPNKKFSFYKFDLRDSTSLRDFLSKNKVDAIIHCAGFKSPEESERQPLSYFDNNLVSSVTLFQEALFADVKTFIFSSSASVYGLADTLPINEDQEIGTISNAYARTKLIIEEMLLDMYSAYEDLKIICLRYFNPVGSHSSALIGDNPKNTPNNLMPRINNVILGKQKKLKIYGDDYNTRDGTGIRDYIHIVDLAKGHCKALTYLEDKTSIFDVINLGRGEGTTVLELIKAYEDCSGEIIPTEIEVRREGDIEESWADVSKAKKLLSWEAKFDLDDICRDNWTWLQTIPKNNTES